MKSLLDHVIGKNFVNGKWLSSSAYLDVINPYTAEKIGSIPNLSPTEINSAIDNTVNTFHIWSQSSFERRVSVLRKWYYLVLENVNQLAHVLTLEQGKILEESKKEILYGASFIDWYSCVVHDVAGVIKPGNNKNHKIITEYEPVGPIASITPWNFPNAMITRKVVPAIAAGCSVILKPSSLTPFSALLLAELAVKAGLPEGVFNVITGDSELIGKIFCDDFRIRKLSFTGSTKIGKVLYQNSAYSVKRLSLELGGNAPFIIFADCDINKTVDDLIAAKTRNSGQSCTAPNRIYIEEIIYDNFIKAFAEKFVNIKAGDGFDTKSNIGPLINKVAIDKILKLLDDAQDKGAKLIFGGKASRNLLEATLIVNCSENMEIFKTEIFGPVVACYKFTECDEVIKQANNTEYGLQAYVYSQDLAKAQIVASKLDFGMVSINDPLPANVKAVFAGRKASGFGIEGSREGIFEYLNSKYISLKLT